MLTFFRRIRKGLLEGGRISKYLLYAIGEILLVVIGILIALQINNRNEWRKDRINERFYLSQLAEEFTDNYERSEIGIAFHETQISNANLVLTAINSDSSVDDLEALHFALIQIAHAWGGSFNENIWSELKNTGNIGLITNDSFRQAITEFHSSAQQMIINELEWSRYNLKYRDITGSVLPPEMRISIAESLGHYKILSKIEEPLLSFKKIQRELEDIEGIESVISDVIIVRKVGKIILKNLQAQVDEVLQLIKEELGEASE